MLIVKNLFSFYVEFEILLHFLLFYRLLNVNKDVNIQGSNLHEEIKLKSFPYKNCGPQTLSGSFWKKNAKIYGPQF
jgi:hypothetical protein